MVAVKLVVIGGAPDDQEYQLSLPAVFGRAREATFPLPHPLVSRLHCELFERNGELHVRDLGSTNGTFVGSERVFESPLRHGELLTIGTVTFRAQLNGMPWEPEEFPPESTLPRAHRASEAPLPSEAETTTMHRTDTDHILPRKPAVVRQKIQP